MRKKLFSRFANNKGADQPAPSGQSLHYSLTGKQNIFQVSIFELVSVAEQAALSMTWSETKKTGFLATRPIYSNFSFIDRYMVDAADHDKVEASWNEQHNLLDKPQLQGIPGLVLGNKRDLPGPLDEKELIDRKYVLL